MIYEGGKVSTCVHNVWRPLILGSTLILYPSLHPAFMSFSQSN